MIPNSILFALIIFIIIYLVGLVLSMILLGYGILKKNFPLVISTLVVLGAYLLFGTALI
jgi:hypothetical protein